MASPLQPKPVAQYNVSKTDSLHPLISCEECDTIYQRVKLAKGERAYCRCCGAEIYREVRSFQRLLACALTALIIFIIANSFPIVKVEVQGNFLETTLLGAAWAMFKIDRAVVGIVVLITTFIVPLTNLLLLIYVFSSICWLKHRPKFLVFSLKTLHIFKTWGMIEVFLIGVLVTLVKLVNVVIVIPEIALWAFGILSVFMVYINAFRVQDIWDEIDRRLP